MTFVQRPSEYTKRTEAIIGFRVTASEIRSIAIAATLCYIDTFYQYSSPDLEIARWTGLPTGLDYPRGRSRWQMQGSVTTMRVFSWVPPTDFARQRCVLLHISRYDQGTSWDKSLFCSPREMCQNDDAARRFARARAGLSRAIYRAQSITYLATRRSIC